MLIPASTNGRRSCCNLRSPRLSPRKVLSVPQHTVSVASATSDLVRGSVDRRQDSGILHPTGFPNRTRNSHQMRRAVPPQSFCATSYCLLTFHFLAPPVGFEPTTHGLGTCAPNMCSTGSRLPWIEGRSSSKGLAVFSIPQPPPFSPEARYVDALQDDERESEVGATSTSGHGPTSIRRSANSIRCCTISA
jgi:hypothetical protein